MHPLISCWPSFQFYNAQLEDGIKETARRAPSGFPWANAGPVAFIPIDGSEALDRFSETSKRNESEADVLFDIVCQLLHHNAPPSSVHSMETAQIFDEFQTSADDATTTHTNLKTFDCIVDKDELDYNPGRYLQPRDIGVVTPYAAQLRYLRSKFSQNGGMQKGERFHGLEIKSVDGYQGREKEVIVFSAVRSNKQRQIGFLGDRRRINVAITRARRGLIVLGNHETLRHNHSWRSYIKFMERRQLIVTPRQLYSHYEQEPPPTLKNLDFTARTQRTWRSNRYEPRQGVNRYDPRMRSHGTSSRW